MGQYYDEMLKLFGEDGLKKPATRGMMVEAIDFIKEKLIEHHKAILDLQTKGLKFAGVWQRALTYGRGSVVTYEGSAWVALKDVDEGSRPGSDLDGWQLMVKAGRDAR